MPSITESVNYIVGVKDNASRSLQGITNKVGGLNKAVGLAKANIAAIGATILTSIGGATVIQVLQRSVDMYDTQLKAQQQVKQAIESTGGAARRSFPYLLKMAQDLQKTTLFGDEQILQEATAQLLTFTNIAGTEFDRVQKASLDIATRLGGKGRLSLTSVSIMLGKALNDPVANLGALSRSGIQFSKEQKELVKQLAESNRLFEAQALILDELERQYGGSAEAAAKVGLGSFQQFQNRMNDTWEDVGRLFLPNTLKLIPTFDKLRESIVPTFESLIKLGNAIKENIILPIGSAVNAFQGLLIEIGILNKDGNLLAGLFSIMGKALNILTIPLKIVWSILKGFLSIITQIISTLKDWRGMVIGFLTDMQKMFGWIPGVEDGLQRLIDKLQKVRDEQNKQSKKVPFNKMDRGGMFDVLAGLRRDGSGLPVPTGTPTDIKSGISEVKSGAPKTFNININKLIELLQVNQTTMKEGATELKDELSKILLSAVTDINQLDSAN